MGVGDKGAAALQRVYPHPGQQGARAGCSGAPAQSLGNRVFPVEISFHHPARY